jgi:hypothetical protein
MHYQIHGLFVFRDRKFQQVRMLNKITNTKQLQENGSKSLTPNAQGCSG